MSAPAFQFTDRAKPIVQFGRIDRTITTDSRWGRAHWGVSEWGLEAWEPEWWDATCDIHEITTDTGRNNAIDRFAPATCEIVASNVNDLFDQIFPELPPPVPFEPLPGDDDTVTLVDPPLDLTGTFQAHGTGTTATIGPFGSPQIGDLIYVVFVSHQSGSTGVVPVTLPGWAVADSTGDALLGSTGGLTWSLVCFRHVVAAEDPSSWTATLDTSAEWNWAAAVFRNIISPQAPGFALDQPIFGGDPVDVTCVDRTADTAGSMVLRYYASYHPHAWGSLSGCHTYEHVNPGTWSWDGYLALDGPAGNPTLVGTGSVGAKSLTLTVTPPEHTVGATIIIRPGPAVTQPDPWLEEIGMYMRVGIDHTELGKHWLFRGYIDELVPVYMPERPDALKITGICALGEAGRVEIDNVGTPAESDAHDRIHQILNRANWPRAMRSVSDEATPMSRYPNGRAVDALTRVAESCGGAVYGDPVTGKLTFRGRDWQTSDGTEPDAVISNYHGPFPRLPVVCPSGWEMAWRRSTTTSRAFFTAESTGVTRAWRAVIAERYFGIEDYHASLLTVSTEALNELAWRHLRLRSVRVFPRVEAVQLDAATADECLDLMTTATFTGPSLYRCQLRRNNEFVFNNLYLLTGIRHRITPEAWTSRFALHRASAYIEEGAKWGRAQWGRGTWGRTF